MEISEVILQKLQDRKITGPADAKQRLQRIAAKMTPAWQIEMQRNMKRIRDFNSSTRAKLKKVYELVDITGKLKESEVACKKGCSACCHMQVEINNVEAEIIGKEIGRTPVRMPAGRSTTRTEALGRPDTPCTFLRGGECSIYEIRPFVCRDLAVVDEDALTCSFENMAMAFDGDSRAVDVQEAKSIPIGDLFSELYNVSGASWADVRQFFPPET